MKLTMLGTGNALVTECYNTCFILQENNEYFMIDGGGGSMILHQLQHADIDWKNIRNIFVTHKHIDHITGILWMIRMICQYMNQDEYEGEKHHSTVKDACILAEELNIKNLLLYHTEDKNISHRKELYYNEGKKYFNGKLLIPDDLESVEL